MPHGKFGLKPTHEAVRKYYRALEEAAQLHIDHELGVKHAFEGLLEHCAKRFYGWNFAREKTVRLGAKTLRPDGLILDNYELSRGWFEAKDTQDELTKEARSKFAVGYPKRNILFWQPGRVLLFQDGVQVLDVDATEPQPLVDALRLFFEHQEPDIDEWERAVEEFKERIPELADSLLKLVHDERPKNKAFQTAFKRFYDLCKVSLNPNLSEAAVEEMLIQHLLTERIFRKVFDNDDFRRKNVIAAEIETVIDALTSKSFSRHDFVKKLDRFYAAIENTALSIGDYSQKQGFLNTVYEQFFQGFSVKVADTHGIVYTPQPIVDFMVKSVDQLLKSEFGKADGLASPGVHVLDPFVGTGNFLLRVLRQIADGKKTNLPEKYLNELHANEVMLLPYYIASMNIEHEYLELAGEYRPFPGVCLVDTFELAEDRQMGLFTEANTERVEAQKQAPIRVVIGNPPYNVGQVNENDNNKNRKYSVIDARVKETYSKDSKASSKSKLDDPYIKAIRWASDRIGDQGVVALVSNNGFLDGIATDGIRQHLEEDFDQIHILDLGGNVRKNPKLSGTTHNVFGIQVGVSINLLVKTGKGQGPATLHYYRTDEFWRKEDKYRYLEEVGEINHIDWKTLEPDAKHTWLTEGIAPEFDTMPVLGSKGAQERGLLKDVFFQRYSLGVSTNRDVWAYNFDWERLAANIRKTIDAYNGHVTRWAAIESAKRKRSFIDRFVDNDPKEMAWSRDLKLDLFREKRAKFREEKIRRSLYRPFCRQFLFHDSILNEEPRHFHEFFPTAAREQENCCVSVGGYGRKDFAVLAGNSIFDLNFYGDPHQVFPFYTYDPDGTNRSENLTDWALAEYRAHYQDDSISKWDIFHYIYALLHHPAYRERYKVNLKKSLPRIPYAPVFHPFAAAGERLAELHVEYQSQTEYPLQEIWKPDTALDLRVERMKYKPAEGRIVYNDVLTLDGIPPTVEEYRLGNRSALGWVVDQYRVKTDKRSGIVNDPNRDDDPKSILRLIGQVITISLETVEIVNNLPDLGLPSD